MGFGNLPETDHLLDRTRELIADMGACDKMNRVFQDGIRPEKPYHGVMTGFINEDFDHGACVEKKEFHHVAVCPNSSVSPGPRADRLLGSE